MTFTFHGTLGPTTRVEKASLVLGLLLATVLMWPLRHYLTDDTFIHLQYARNLAAGHGFVFNQGERIYGSTSPLWVALIADGMALGLDGLLVARAIGLIATRTRISHHEVAERRLCGVGARVEQIQQVARGERTVAGARRRRALGGTDGNGCCQGAGDIVDAGGDRLRIVPDAGARTRGDAEGRANPRQCPRRGHREGAIGAGVATARGPGATVRVGGRGAGRTRPKDEDRIVR